MDSIIRKGTFSFLLVLLLSNCKQSTSQEVKGNYSVKKNTYTTRLILHDNGKFEYYHKEKLAEQSSKGTWLKEGEYIVLNNDIEYKKGVESSYEEYDDNIGVRIILKDNIGDSLFGFGITINENEKTGWSTNESGIVEVKDKLEVSRITIHYLSDKYQYTVNDKENNVFKLVLKPENRSIKYFDNEKFTLTKNGIIDSDGDLLIKE